MHHPLEFQWYFLRRAFWNISYFMSFFALRRKLTSRSDEARFITFVADDLRLQTVCESGSRNVRILKFKKPFERTWRHSVVWTGSGRTEGGQNPSRDVRRCSFVWRKTVAAFERRKVSILSAALHYDRLADDATKKLWQTQASGLLLCCLRHYGTVNGR